MRSLVWAATVILLAGAIAAAVRSEWASDKRHGVAVYPAAVVSEPAPEPTPPAVGRYIIVNGTPSMAKNIMLIDTATGDSWISCTDKQTPIMWCSMERELSAVEKLSLEERKKQLADLKRERDQELSR